MFSAATRTSSTQVLTNPIYLMARRHISLSVASTLKELQEGMQQLSSEDQVILRENNTLHPNFGAHGLQAMRIEEKPTFWSDRSNTTPIIVAANNSLSSLRRSVDQVRRFPNIDHILVAKGSKVSDIRQDLELDSKYKGILRYILGTGIKPAVIANIHEPTEVLRRSLEYKYMHGARILYTQPIFNPYSTLPSETITLLKQIAKRDIPLNIGILPVTENIENNRKRAIKDDRVDQRGMDRYLMKTRPSDMSLVDYSDQSLDETIDFALELYGLSPSGNVDLYTRFGLNIKMTGLERIIARIRNTPFNLQNR